MGVNWTEIAVLVLVVVLLFGGKVSGFMSELAAGLKTFRRTMTAPDNESQASRENGKSGIDKDGDT